MSQIEFSASKAEGISWPGILMVCPFDMELNVSYLSNAGESPHLVTDAQQHFLGSHDGLRTSLLQHWDLVVFPP